jgi:hypothetical protein
VNRWESERWDKAIPAGLAENTSRQRYTGGGHWTYRDADLHRCPKPNYQSGVKAGDRWKCDTCNTEYRVKSIDPSLHIMWEDYEAYKAGPFAPGTK